MKEFGFKVLAHLMPDLPGSSPEMDHQMIDDVLYSGSTRRVRDVRFPAGCAIPVASAMVAAVFGLAAAIVVTAFSCGVLLVVEQYYSHTAEAKHPQDSCAEEQSCVLARVSSCL